MKLAREFCKRHNLPECFFVEVLADGNFRAFGNPTRLFRFRVAAQAKAKELSASCGEARSMRFVLKGK